MTRCIPASPRSRPSREATWMPAAWAAAILVFVSASACRKEPAAASASPAPVPTAASSRIELGFLDESREPVGGEGGTLARRLTGEPATLDPILQSTGAEAEVLQYVARNLF